MPNLAPSILSHPCAAVSALPVFFLGCQPQWPDALDRNGCLTSPVSLPHSQLLLFTYNARTFLRRFWQLSVPSAPQALSAAPRQGSIGVTAGIWQGRSRVWVLRWLRVVRKDGWPRELPLFKSTPQQMVIFDDE